MTVSVIIPMYNAAKSIISTLESVRNQTYQDLEIIIVNDGSTDASEAIVENFIKNNPGLKVNLILQKNQGVSSARNKGLKLATGEWIAFIDSDDEWLPIKLERQINTIQNNAEIEFLGTNRNGEFFSNFMFKKFFQLTLIKDRDLLLKMFFITPTVIFKRQILSEVGYFDEDRKYGEDGHFFLRIAKIKKCYLLNESLVITGGGKAHFGEKGLSSNLWKMQQGEQKNIDYALENKVVNWFEYLVLLLFSYLKFLRRFLVTNIKKFRI